MALWGPILLRRHFHCCTFVNCYVVFHCLREGLILVAFVLLQDLFVNFTEAAFCCLELCAFCFKMFYCIGLFSNAEVYTMQAVL